MRCFAMAKDSEWTDVRDRDKPESVPTCYVLNPEEFKKMLRFKWCGDPRKCPFCKMTRTEVR